MVRNFAAGICVLMCACSGARRGDAGHFDLHRLEGRWESTRDRFHRFEEWQMAPEGGLNGRGYVLEGGDTTFIEFLQIREEEGVLTYFAQVGDQHNREVVPFRVGGQSSDRIEFRNPGHDFPTRIVYVLPSPDSLHVFIEGPRDEGTYRIDFDFVRSPEAQN